MKIKCIFCNKPADTREHIPARHLFKGISEKSLITVPSCKRCNSGFQNDEEFFRQFNAGFLMDRSQKAKEIMNSEVTRSIQRKPALAHQMFGQMKLVDAYTKSGVYVGKVTAYRINDSDTKRINRVVTKIIKGLFWHEFKQLVPKDWIINIVWINPKLSKELNLPDLEKTLKWTVIKDDTFAYGMQYVPETFQSIWILDLFKVPVFYVLVLDKKTANQKHSKTV